MRKPKPTPTSSGTEAPTPAGGRALGRASQFTFSRGLPPPVVETPATVKKPKSAASKPAAKKLVAKPAKKSAKKPA